MQTRRGKRAWRLGETSTFSPKYMSEQQIYRTVAELPAQWRAKYNREDHEYSWRAANQCAGELEAVWPVYKTALMQALAELKRIHDERDGLREQLDGIAAVLRDYSATYPAPYRGSFIGRIAEIIFPATPSAEPAQSGGQAQ